MVRVVILNHQACFRRPSRMSSSGGAQEVAETCRHGQMGVPPRIGPSLFGHDGRSSEPLSAGDRSEAALRDPTPAASVWKSSD